MSRTLHLTERRPRLARLAPDEVAYLVAHHREHLDIAPTARRHTWRVTSMGVVGVLWTPRRRVVIAPKIPLQTLLLFADETAEVTGHDHAQTEDGSGLLDLLAGLLASRMLQLARGGLHRAYLQTPTQGSFLVGTLDVAAQLRQAPHRRDQLHGRLDDLTTLLPCNLVPRRLAGLLLPIVDVGARVALEQAIAAFAEIPDGPLLPDLLTGLDAPGHPMTYTPMLDVCRLLLDSLGPSPQAGMTSTPALLVSLERLFERHVTRMMEEAFTGEARPQFTQRIVGPPDLIVRPDVVVERNGRNVLIVDAKWRKLSRETLFNDDVYQVLAYATAYDCRRVVLVYPGRRKTWRHDFANGVRLEVRTLDVSGTPATCLEARRRLGAKLLRQTCL